MAHSKHTVNEILCSISSSFSGLVLSQHSFAAVRITELVAGALTHTTEAKARAQGPSLTF